VNTETKKTLQKIAGILWLLVGVIIIVIILVPSDKEDAQKEPKTISQANAVVICQSYYEDLYEKGTGFKATIGMFAEYDIAEMRDTWVLNVWGECQNKYGAWMQVSARCVVNKKPIGDDLFDYKNISWFEFNI